MRPLFFSSILIIELIFNSCDVSRNLNSLNNTENIQFDSTFFTIDGLFLKESCFDSSGNICLFTNSRRMSGMFQYDKDISLERMYEKGFFAPYPTTIINKSGDTLFVPKVESVVNMLDFFTTEKFDQNSFTIRRKWHERILEKEHQQYDGFKYSLFHLKIKATRAGTKEVLVPDFSKIPHKDFYKKMTVPIYVVLSVTIVNDTTMRQLRLN